MAQTVSAGLLCYRRGCEGAVEVLLAHPGGPFFARQDAHAWGIPKGLVNEGEDLLAAARREFEEELGWAADAAAEFIPLGWVRMKSGKTVHAWAFGSHLSAVPKLAGASVFTLEWPPKSGRQQTSPEVDRADFFGLSEATEKMLPAQLPFLERLQSALARADLESSL